MRPSAGIKGLAWPFCKQSESFLPSNLTAQGK